MDKHKKLITLREDDLKSTELKLLVMAEHMKDKKICMNEEDTKEYKNIIKALDINVEILSK